MFWCREAPTTTVVGLYAFCNFHPFCIESFWYFHIEFTCFYWFSGSRAIYVPIQMVCEPLLGHSFCPFGFQCFLAMWWEASMGKRALESALDLAEVERHAQDFAEKHPYWKLVAKMEGHRDRMTSCIWPMSFVLFVGWFFLRIGASRSAFWGAKSTQDLHFQQQSVGGVRGQLTTAAVYLLGSRGASVSRSCVEPYNVIGRCCFQNGSVLAFMFFLFRSLVSHTMNPRSTKPFVKVERWAQWWCHLAGCRSIEWWMVMRNEILYICHGVVT